MLNTLAECQDTARLLESRRREGRGRYREALDNMCELARNGEIDTSRFSIRNCAEAFIRDSHGDVCGVEAVREMESARRDPGSQTFMEAGGDAINTADFSNIIGQISYSRVLDRMENPELIAGQLMTETPATTQQHEIIPGVSMVGDKAQAVGENEDYPMVGLSEQWVVVPDKIKYGFMMAVTEEMIVEDKTGLLMRHMNTATDALAINQEKDRMNTITGITTSFRWKNVAAQATYANSFTGFTLDNLIASNGLADYTDLDAVKNAFNDIVDPSTGEPVMLGGQIQVLVPDPLETTLGRILNSIETRQGDITTGSGIQTVTAGSPLQYTRRRFAGYTNQYVSVATSSDTTWFAGNFKEAFEDRVIWPLGMFVEDGTSGTKFERDWVTRIKVRRKSAPTVVSPWKVVKCTQ